MVSKEFTINNELGMHMRPASLLSQMAAKYQSNITVKHNGKDFNAKSVMLLMTALIKCGSQIEVVCDGPDEEAALAEITAFIDSGMGD
ncbi:MAG: HPr family phosphocarrier protein [Mogibacterium sp.]|jgi:phosphocarrier protein|nr:HPr family phosphocarrier protein [Mogibacterium sp.]MBR3329808.1 HPr family phosphocarrier protein [Mogibacterium sp.]MBR4089345.1 HPr family phosphocarrier protein [Mogibacterium sp.]